MFNLIVEDESSHNFDEPPLYTTEIEDLIQENNGQNVVLQEKYGIKVLVVLAGLSVLQQLCLTDFV